MTGEVTLRGRVLPIGGLREKTMAALRCGIRKVFLPSENEPDLAEIDPAVRAQLEFVSVSGVDQVLSQALENGALPERQPRQEFPYVPGAPLGQKPGLRQ